MVSALFTVSNLNGNTNHPIFPHNKSVLHDTTNLCSPIRQSRKVTFTLPISSPSIEEEGFTANASKRRMPDKNLLKNKPIKRLEKLLERCKMQLVETAFETEVRHNELIELAVENEKLQSRIERRKRRMLKLESSLDKMQKRYEKYSKKIHNLKEDIMFYETKSAQMMKELKEVTEKVDTIEH